MSELDADLYGGRNFVSSLLVGVPDISVVDLYGNDEADFASAVESHELKPEELKTEVPSETPAPPATKLSEVKQEFKVTTPALQPIKSEYVDSYDDYTAATAQLGSSPQNAPQQIPTYQQPSDYSVDVSHSGAHPNMPERSVRPSEMKDEG